jgi:hypothetical protein
LDLLAVFLVAVALAEVVLGAVAVLVAVAAGFTPVFELPALPVATDLAAVLFAGEPFVPAWVEAALFAGAVLALPDAFGAGACADTLSTIHPIANPAAAIFARSRTREWPL